MSDEVMENEVTNQAEIKIETTRGVCTIKIGDKFVNRLDLEDVVVVVGYMKKGKDYVIKFKNKVAREELEMASKFLEKFEKVKVGTGVEDIFGYIGTEFRNRLDLEDTVVVEDCYFKQGKCFVRFRNKKGFGDYLERKEFFKKYEPNQDSQKITPEGWVKENKNLTYAEKLANYVKTGKLSVTDLLLMLRRMSTKSRGFKYFREHVGKTTDSGNPITDKEIIEKVNLVVFSTIKTLAKKCYGKESNNLRNNIPKLYTVVFKGKPEDLLAIISSADFYDIFPEFLELINASAELGYITMDYLYISNPQNRVGSANARKTDIFK